MNLHSLIQVWHLRRVKVTKNGFAGQSLGDQPALLLLRGKSGRSESTPADVAEAVNRSHAGCPLPGGRLHH